jgi:hypothetical protein
MRETIWRENVFDCHAHLAGIVDSDVFVVPIVRSARRSSELHFLKEAHRMAIHDQMTTLRLFQKANRL